MSSTAYDAVLDRFELRERLDLLLKDVDVNNLDDLAGKSMCVCYSSSIHIKIHSQSQFVRSSLAHRSWT